MQKSTLIENYNANLSSATLNCDSLVTEHVLVLAINVYMNESNFSIFYPQMGV